VAWPSAWHLIVGTVNFLETMGRIGGAAIEEAIATRQVTEMMVVVNGEMFGLRRPMKPGSKRSHVPSDPGENPQSLA
jgi:hypothetical protein